MDKVLFVSRWLYKATFHGRLPRHRLRLRLEPVEIDHGQLPFTLMEINKIADPGPNRVARIRYLRIGALSPCEHRRALRTKDWPAEAVAEENAQIILNVFPIKS